MKRIVITLIIAFFAAGSFAQSSITGLDNYGVGNNASSGLSGNTFSNTDFNLQMGTSIGSYGGGGSVLSSYVAPSFNFDATPKLDIKAGALIMNNNFSGFQQSPFMSQSMGLNQNMTDSYLYVQGDYQLNEKLTLSGGAIKKVNTYNYQQKMNPLAKNYDYSAYNIGMRYKVNDNAHIEAQFNLIKGNPYQTPFNNYASPFGHYSSPFGGFNDPTNPFD
ncbi:MAG: hypothetical protein K9I94_13100 [Bacteroidales bacterium]|nr:hypothetical protein [Bacteroidales bacterium]